MKDVTIRRGEKYLNALMVLTRPLREDIAYDLAILGTKFISFEKDVREAENGGVIASTRWIKNDVEHILAKLTNINKIVVEEKELRIPTEYIYKMLYEKIFETCLNSNVVHITQEFIEDMTKFIAHCIADLHYEEYDIKERIERGFIDGNA